MKKIYQKNKNVIPAKAGIQTKITLSDLFQAFLKRKIMLFSIIVLVVTLPIFFLVMKYQSKVEAAWFNDNWLYRITLTIGNTGAADANKKVKFDIDTATLITAGKIQADCGDSRFTDINGRVLKYYIDTAGGACNTISTDYYVLVPTIFSGNTVLYHYYGNPSAENGTQSSQFSEATFTPTSGPTGGSEEKSAGPVAYWKFDEGYGTSTNDSTQDNYDGSLGSTAGTDATAPTWVTEDQCVSGKCLKFNGTTDAVDFDDYDNLKALQFDTGNWSVSAWIRAPSGSSKRVVFGLRTGADQDFHIGIDTSNRAYVEWVSYPSKPAYTTTTSSSTVADNKWHQIAAKREGGTITLYIDGVSVGTDSTVSNYDITGPGWFSRWTAGAWFNGCCTTFDAGVWQYFFKGFMDDVKVYNYARSAAQIKADYNSRGSASPKGAGAALGADSRSLAAFSNGLVGYWKMDESATPSVDSSGNGNSGTWAGNATAATGKFSNGISLDGTGDWVSIGSVATYNLAGSNFTLCSWFKTSGTEEDIVANGVGGDGLWLLMSYQNKLRGHVWYSGNSNTIDSNAIVNNNAWRHGCQVVDDTKIYLYIDGALDNSQNLSGTKSGTTGTTIIGSRSAASAGNNFAGTLDDVRIYNRALSSKEVRDLYAWAPGPVAYYKLDEGSGTSSVNDSSGNGITGTLQSSPTWSTGKFGKGLRFNGTSQYITTSSNPLTYFTASKGYTTEAWVKLEQYQPDGGPGGCCGSRIAYTNSGDGGFDWRIWNNGVVNFYRPTTWCAAGSSATVPLNQWVHLAATYNNQQVYVYMNGVQIASTNSCNFLDSTAGITFNNPGGSHGLYGSMDDFRVYNYARTSKQIVEDMNAGHPAPGSPVGSAVGYWKMDEGQGITANNSGNGGSPLNGTLTNMASPATATSGWSNSGKFGKALSFDGTDDYVDIADNSSFSFPNKSFTVEAWVKPSVSPDDYDAVVGKWNNQAPATKEWLFRFGVGDTVEFRLIDSTNTSIGRTTTTTISTGVWTHILGTYDGTTANPNGVKIYINGVRTDTIDIGTSFAGMSDTTSKLFMGAVEDTVTGNFSLFNGQIDEVKIYNSALTEDEIKLDYNRGSAMVLGKISTDSDGSTPSDADSRGYCIPGDTTSCSAPVGEWKMDEKTGTTAYDTSGNNRNLSFGNTPTWINGKVGAALDFDRGDYAYVDWTDFTLSNQTIEFWVKADSLTGGWEDLVGTYLSTDLNRFHFYSGTSAISFYNIHGSCGTLNSGVVPVVGQWYHVAGVTDGTNAILYVNGQRKTSTTCSGSHTATGVYLAGPSGETFDGQIDHVKIYDYARTPAQIAWDYNRGGPVGWWKLDECQGGTANDASGNANNGTITIGATGSQTAVGTCTTSGTAWYNGVTGKYNSSLNFDGTDDYVTVNQTLSTPISVTGWAKQTDFTKTLNTFINSNPHTVLAISLNRTGIGDIYVYIGNGSVWLGAPAIISSVNMVQSAWHYVTYVSDGSTSKLYLDGALVGTSSYVPSGWGSYYRFGAIVQGGEYMKGQLDDVRIYNYALTANQIKTLFNENSAIRFGPSSGSP